MKRLNYNCSNIIKTLAIFSAMAVILCSFSLSLSAIERNSATPLSSTAEDYVIYYPKDLDIAKSAYTNVNTGKDEESGFDVLTLTTTADTGDASITLNVNINADVYKYASFLVKKSIDGAELHIKYKKAGSEKYGSILKNNYGVIKSWQFLSFDMKNVQDWNGTVDTLTLEYLKPYDFPAGSQCTIAAIILAKNVEFALDGADEIIGDTFKKVHSITEFTEDDLKDFSIPSSTSVSIENNILKFTGIEHPDHPGKTYDPYVAWAYSGFADSTVTADDFNFIEFKYRTSGAPSNKGFNIYYITSNKGFGESHRTDGGKYTDSQDWNYLRISFVGEADWTGIIKQFRLDWDNGGDVDENGNGAILEIDEINFYKSTSNFDFSTILSGLSKSSTYMSVETTAPETESTTEKVTDPIFDDLDSETVTLPIFNEDTTETETLPIFNTETESEEDTLPNFDVTTEESVSETESETESESQSESESESQSETESESEANSTEESSDETLEEQSTESDFDTSEESSEDESTETSSEKQTEETSSDTENIFDTEDTNDPEETFDETFDNPSGPNNTENESSIDQTQNAGSQMPFYIACGTMGTLSVGSIGSVIAIKFRSKFLIWKLRSRRSLW